MTIKRIAHASFKVTDMAKAVAYYCDGLGFTDKFELQDDQGARGSSIWRSHRDNSWNSFTTRTTSQKRLTAMIWTAFCTSV
ncbi:VOC family protein [Secundilactobacillus paracollinoides]|uniref:VOC family protein n=1 Tax=Secundilactobacillus paracollinoides TaxID=240427 RepID=UPI000AC02EC1